MHLVPKPPRKDRSSIHKKNEEEYPKIKKPGNFGIFLLKMWATEPIDRLVYAHLLSHMRKKGHYRCNPSAKTLVAEIGINRKTLFSSLGRLERHGWIKRHKTESSTEYQLFSPETRLKNVRIKRRQNDAVEYAEKTLAKIGLKPTRALIDEADSKKMELIEEYLKNNPLEAQA